jgi:TM2 domain-containing membrane protein YozV
VNTPNDTHSKTIGYVLWLFGFTGSHRFYYGSPVLGTIYFFTLGLLFIGWIIDLFLIPSLDRKADLRFKEGRINYTVAWVLLTFLGFLGIHRIYMGKWISGGGLFSDPRAVRGRRDLRLLDPEQSDFRSQQQRLMATGDTRVLPGPASMGMPDRSDLSDIARWIGYTGWALLSTQPIRLALVLGLSGALSTIAWAAGFFS